MKELFKQPKKATLLQQIIIGEIFDIDEPTDELKYFEKGDEVLVLGIAYEKTGDKQFVVYSESAKEATTVCEVFLWMKDDDNV